MRGVHFFTMTTFLDLPVECRLMVQEFYEADCRLTFDNVLKELLRRTRKVENSTVNGGSEITHGPYGNFEIPITRCVFIELCIRNSPRTIWTKMDLGFAEERSIYKRKIHFLL